MNDSIITTNGLKTYLYRAFTATGDLSATQYLSPTKLQLGIVNGTPVVGDTTLDEPIPIEHGTVLDNGDNTLTGSNGGDDSTDNSTTYKEGANLTDNKAQNLITTGSNVTKTWTIANLAALGANATATKYVGLWLYIKDATALAKFEDAGTVLEIKLGSDAANYYSKTWTKADLAVGWNWLSSTHEVLNEWTETGTVAGDIDTFIIEITTNNAADAFAAGDVVYDLLRQWTLADTKIDWVTGYPSFDMATKTVTLRAYITSEKANGFDINGIAEWNEDATPLMLGEDTITSESKSSTDEFAIIQKITIS